MVKLDLVLYGDSDLSGVSVVSRWGLADLEGGVGEEGMWAGWGGNVGWVGWECGVGGVGKWDGRGEKVGWVW